jgi:hypothetical protein
MLEYNVNFLNWNPIGLNRPKHCDVVRDLVVSTSCQIDCLKETKPEVVDSFTEAHLGGYKLRSFAQRLAIGIRGGILLLWDDQVVQVSNVVVCTFSLSANVTI